MKQGQVVEGLVSLVRVLAIGERKKSRGALTEE